MQHNSPQSGKTILTLRKTGVKVAGVVIDLGIICIIIILLFADPIVNQYGKPFIVNAIAKAYPHHVIRIEKMKYNIGLNRFEFDSVAISAADGTFSISIGSFALEGINWIHILLGGRLTVEDGVKGTIAVNEIVVKFPKAQYELRCESLYASVPESSVVVENAQIGLVGDDEQFFAGSTFQRTRFLAFVPNIQITGLGSIELIQQKSYRMRSMTIRNPIINILVNNDKKSDKNAPSPMMPNDMLASIKPILRADELTIINAQVQYGERDGVGSLPAVISFDSVQLMAEGITNHSDPHGDIVIHAKGNFMKTGRMNVVVVIPVSSPALSFKYYGSVGRMDMSELNTFLEIAEQIRITGILQEATFSANVVSGNAVGSVRPAYRDMSIAFINKKTGNQGGISNQMASFIANTVKLRKNNMPDRSGSVAVGKIHYAQKSDDPFFRFLWFSLRSGVKDVAGF